jgi:outer membrane protein OmpA-like peptidoglycan-associated protein
MPNYPAAPAVRPTPGRRLAHTLAAITAFVGFAVPGAARAQTIVRPEYRLEVGAAGSYARFSSVTNLDPAFGGTARIGYWLPLNFSLEAEGSVLSSHAEGSVLGTTTRVPYSISTLGGALLYNFPLGPQSFFYLKGGFTSQRYSSSNCDSAGIKVGPCGADGGAAKTGAVLGGVGLRVGLSDLVMLRAEGVLTHSGRRSASASGLTTVATNLGLSFMLGAKRPGDADQDGVADNLDRCPSTPAGALVDYRGCPVDADKDGIADGLDRCPNTPAGARVDASGCPRDADKDGITDNLDRCPNTPAGATVDARGCPADADQDGVLDGIDRCPDTPAGASVDVVGCPGDEDGDGVLDGLDRCPHTPAGRAVNAFGCLPGQGEGRDSVRQRAAAAPPPASPQEQSPQAPAPEEAAAPKEAGTGVVLRGVEFAPGSARLSASSLRVLDSVATALAAQPRQLVEIGGHTDDSGSPRGNQNLSRLRAEAVRSYLIRKGIPGARMTARGYGSTLPLIPGDTPDARARNRRVEIKPVGTLP